MKWFKFQKKTSRRYHLYLEKFKKLALVILLITLISTIGYTATKYDWGQKPTIDNNQEQSLPIFVYLSYKSPNLLPSIPPVSQIDSYVSSVSAEKYNLFPNGELSPGTESSKIGLVFSQKPTQQKLQQFFILTTSISYTFPVTKGYLLEDSFYFASSNLPDVIIPISLSAEELSGTLQAIPSLAKIKQETKIIDLRFDHPIIK
jgi:hypothetical protein